MPIVKLPSLRLLLLGCAVFVAAVLLLVLVAPRSEASNLTRTIVFLGLIPPPVCFAAGIFSAMSREIPGHRTGAWVNAGAIVAHGIVVIPILQSFFG
ncbi:MAG: hypothetical protein ACXW2X_09040 [Thermoanaerobaculia bacterium]